MHFKQEAGATHLLTQLFFDNMHFYRFLNLARRAGITLPVSAGVMPIVKRSQIERTVALSSASLPSEFTRMISRYQDDPESLYAAGIDYAVQQLRDLIEGGADGVHLYAMNDAKVAAAVYEGIKDLL
nr:methylenetetrahydrofolate reductase [Gemmiger qucibialis]